MPNVLSIVDTYLNSQDEFLTVKKDGVDIIRLSSTGLEFVNGFQVPISQFTGQIPYSDVSGTPMFAAGANISIQHDPNTNTYTFIGTSGGGGGSDTTVQGLTGDITLSASNPAFSFSINGQDIELVVPPWVHSTQSAVDVSSFGGNLTIGRITNLQSSLDSKVNTVDLPSLTLPNWVDDTQSNVGLTGFGGDLPVGRITNLQTSLNAKANTTDIPTVPSWVQSNQSNVLVSGFGGGLPIGSVTNLQSTLDSKVNTVDLPSLTLPNWVDDTQSNVNLNGFGGDLPIGKITNLQSTLDSKVNTVDLPSLTLPNWVDDTQSNVDVNGFGGDLPVGRITNLQTSLNAKANTTDIPTVPSWVQNNQSNVLVSGFGGGLPIGSVTNLQSTLDSKVNTVDLPSLTLPNWVDDTQSNVGLTGFGGDLPIARVANLQTTLNGKANTTDIPTGPTPGSDLALNLNYLPTDDAVWDPGSVFFHTQEKRLYIRSDDDQNWFRTKPDTFERLAREMVLQPANGSIQGFYQHSGADSGYDLSRFQFILTFDLDVSGHLYDADSIYSIIFFDRVEYERFVSQQQGGREFEWYPWDVMIQYGGFISLSQDTTKYFNSYSKLTHTRDDGLVSQTGLMCKVDESTETLSIAIHFEENFWDILGTFQGGEMFVVRHTKDLGPDFDWILTQQPTATIGTNDGVDWALSKDLETEKLGLHVVRGYHFAKQIEAPEIEGSLFIGYRDPTQYVPGTASYSKILYRLIVQYERMLQTSSLYIANILIDSIKEWYTNIRNLYSASSIGAIPTNYVKAVQEVGTPFNPVELVTFGNDDLFAASTPHGTVLSMPLAGNNRHTRAHFEAKWKRRFVDHSVAMVNSSKFPPVIERTDGDNVIVKYMWFYDAPLYSETQDFVFRDTVRCRLALNGFTRADRLSGWFAYNGSTESWVPVFGSMLPGISFKHATVDTLGNVKIHEGISNDLMAINWGNSVSTDSILSSSDYSDTIDSWSFRLFQACYCYITHGQPDPYEETDTFMHKPRTDSDATDDNSLHRWWFDHVYSNRADPTANGNAYTSFVKEKFYTTNTGRFVTSGWTYNDLFFIDSTSGFSSISAADMQKLRSKIHV